MALVILFARLQRATKEQWVNQTLCEVNDSVVRLGVLQGEFHWHKHDREDEFFYVVEGRFFTAAARSRKRPSISSMSSEAMARQYPSRAYGTSGDCSVVEV